MSPFSFALLRSPGVRRPATCGWLEAAAIHRWQDAAPNSIFNNSALFKYKVSPHTSSAPPLLGLTKQREHQRRVQMLRSAVYRAEPRFNNPRAVWKDFRCVVMPPTFRFELVCSAFYVQQAATCAWLPPPTPQTSALPPPPVQGDQQQNRCQTGGLQCSPSLLLR
jgi:hypothetical protein